MVSERHRVRPVERVMTKDQLVGQESETSHISNVSCDGKKPMKALLGPENGVSKKPIKVRLV